MQCSGSNLGPLSGKHVSYALCRAAHQLHETFVQLAHQGSEILPRVRMACDELTALYLPALNGNSSKFTDESQVKIFL